MHWLGCNVRGEDGVNGAGSVCSPPGTGIHLIVPGSVIPIVGNNRHARASNIIRACPLIAFSMVGTVGRCVEDEEPKSSDKLVCVMRTLVTLSFTIANHASIDHCFPVRAPTRWSFYVGKERTRIGRLIAFVEDWRKRAGVDVCTLHAG